MKKISLFVFLLILIIILSAFNLYFSNNEYLYEIKSQFNNFLYKYSDFEDELPVILHDKSNVCEPPLSIPKTLATEDIEYLFSLLKYGYSGYEFFGGDSVFNKAKNNIIWSTIAIYGEEIYVDKLLDIIYNELKFIQDSHFTIGNYKLCNYTKYFSSRKFSFQEDYNGIYTILDNEKFYVKKIDGKNP